MTINGCPMREEAILISANDAAVLEPLAQQVALLAARPEEEEKRRRWRRLNRLNPVRPLVHICQEPWREFEGREYILACQGELARQVEGQLQQILWRAVHAPVDDAVEPQVWTMAVYTEDAWGLPLPKRSPDLALGALEYPAMIRSLDDVQKIALPTIRFDAAATASKVAAIRLACGNAIRVRPHVPLMPAPWDLLVQWYGTQKLMMDLVDDPGLVHAAIRRTTDMALHRLRQWEEQDALNLNNCGNGAGNGGQAYTDELPQPDFSGRVRLKDLWGNSMAQIFVGVSPEMHEEFALRYEIELLQHFGLNCYGCCEPLHKKVHIVEKIPRLRRISMSPWVDWQAGAKAIAGRFIYSAKPNPAFLAGEENLLESARHELIRILNATRGMPVELVLKDLHSLRGEPRRLTAWAEMAMATVREYGADP